MADEPVTTANGLKGEANGFQLLAITLSNKGNLPLKIEKITVHIPVAERLKNDLQIYLATDPPETTNVIAE